MSTEYTKNVTNDIYFLNDRNIATTLSDEIAKNAIPSNELFKEKYNELTATDNEINRKLEDLNSKTEQALVDAKTYTDKVSSDISGIINNNRTSDKNELSNVLSSYTNKQVSDLSTHLSDTVEEKFVNVSGDTITGELKVDKVLATELSSGDTNISGNVSISGKKVIIGNSSARYDNMFVWNADEGNYEGNTVDSNTGKTFNINPLHGSRGFFIGNESLSAIISNDTQLTATNIRNEIDVVSSLMIKDYALKNDVKSEIDRIDNTGYLISSDFDFEYKDQKIWLSAGAKVVSIDAGDFIKDGMLSSVELTTYQVGDELHQGLKFIFNTDQNQTPIYVDLNQLVDVYKGSNGINVDIDTYTITPDFGIIAKTSDVKEISGNLSQLSSSVKEISNNYEIRLTTISNDLDEAEIDITNLTTSTNSLQSYVNTLSGNGSNTGTIFELSNGIKQTNEKHQQDFEYFNKILQNNATFAGTIQIDTENNAFKQNDKLSALLEKQNSNTNRVLKSGDIYQIEFINNDFIDNITDPFRCAKTFYDTSDNPSVRLAHKDYIVIYTPNIGIQLTYDNVHNFVKVIPAVRFYELYQLSVTVSSDYFWLSGGNNNENNHAISGNNYFKDTNYFENISVQNISATTAVIEDISVANSLSGDWSKIVDSTTKFSLFDLCTAVSSKIFIDNRVDEDGTNGTSDLSIVKLSKAEYDNIVASNNRLKDNVLYIVDSDYIDAYGHVIKNLTMSDLSGKEASEAVNKSYFENVVSNISSYLSDEISLKYIEKKTVKSAISALTLQSQLSDVITALSILNSSL